MSTTSDRVAPLEAQVAELRALADSAKHEPRRPLRRGLRRGPRRLLMILGVVLALVVPALTLAGGQTFNDVPPTHQFFASIEEVAAAGVTAGCGDGTNYCPNGLVTRGQMAAFMARLGALSPSRPPVVNATQLDGLDSSAFARPMFAVVNANGTLARDVGAVSVAHNAGSGIYRVQFDRNVRSCSYSATIGLGGAEGVENPGFITVVGDALSVNGVYVTTDDIAGASADRAFHLTIMCAGQTGGTAGLLEAGAAITPHSAHTSGENE